MNSEQKELFRISVLRVLQANGTRKFGLNILNIKTFVTLHAFDVTEEEVQLAINYMEGEPHKFVEKVNKGEFSPENEAWKITTRGMNFLAQRGF